MTKLEEITRKQNNYVLANGGFHNLREANGIYNEMNREQIAAFKEQHGTAYLGKINYHDDREAVIDGSKSVYVEYTGQMVYNAGCSFCVPYADEKLAELIRKWNRFSDKKDSAGINAITNRIEQIGGLNFIWY